MKNFPPTKCLLSMNIKNYLIDRVVNQEYFVGNNVGEIISHNIYGKCLIIVIV